TDRSNQHAGTDQGLHCRGAGGRDREVRPIPGGSPTRHWVNRSGWAGGIAEQLGLATKLSGWHGARRLTLARDLVLQLPGTFDLLARGEISEYAAQLIAAETSHLDPETRGQVDRHLVAAGIERLA